jgi:hypothetical protein
MHRKTRQSAAQNAADRRRDWRPPARNDRHTVRPICSLAASEFCRADSPPAVAPAPPDAAVAAGEAVLDVRLLAPEPEPAGEAVVAQAAAEAAPA